MVLRLPFGRELERTSGRVIAGYHGVREVPRGKPEDLPIGEGDPLRDAGRDKSGIWHKADLVAPVPRAHEVQLEDRFIK